MDSKLKFRLFSCPRICWPAKSQLLIMCLPVLDTAQVHYCKTEHQGQGEYIKMNGIINTELGAY